MQCVHRILYIDAMTLCLSVYLDVLFGVACFMYHNLLQLTDDSIYALAEHCPLLKSINIHSLVVCSYIIPGFQLLYLFLSSLLHGCADNVFPLQLICKEKF